MQPHTVSQSTATGWNFDNSYARLPEPFYSTQHPTPVKTPGMAVFNRTFAESIGLDSDTLAGQEGALFFGGNQLPPGAAPIAQAYAGHQFGHFTMLGDGRAILLGEHLAPDGTRFDIQLKGSGQTPFSRRGDGRAALGPMLREYIISEAMAALGIPTTRSLAVVTTGEPVFRDTPLPGAILTRVASSHIRVGTFEFAANFSKPEELRALADYTLARHYPEARQADNPYLELLRSVMTRQASLVAKWQCVGFIHGVMNTDNMALSGETIDYGPCAFMDHYDPATVFSSIDRQGRYAYSNQPPIAQWNLARFAEALLPLLDPDPETAIHLAQVAISEFPALFQGYWLSGMRAKLGLFNEEAEDITLIQDLLTRMHQQQADFTRTFRLLSSGTLAPEPFFAGAAFTDWHAQWQARLNRQPESFHESQAFMRAHNPSVIPRNYRVEEALEAAVTQGNLKVMEMLLEALKDPYADIPAHEEYRLPPPPSEYPYQTFCGT